jgi:hypothetical protein
MLFISWKGTSVTSLDFFGGQTHQRGKKKYTVFLEVLFSSHHILLEGLYLVRCETAKQCSLSTCKGLLLSGGYIALKILPAYIVTIIFINKSLFMTEKQFKETVTWKAGSLQRTNHFGVVNCGGKRHMFRKGYIWGRGGRKLISSILIHVFKTPISICTLNKSPLIYENNQQDATV